MPGGYLAALLAALATTSGHGRIWRPWRPAGGHGGLLAAILPARWPEQDASWPWRRSPARVTTVSPVSQSSQCSCQGHNSPDHGSHARGFTGGLRGHLAASLVALTAIWRPQVPLAALVALAVSLAALAAIWRPFRRPWRPLAVMAGGHGRTNGVLGMEGGGVASLPIAPAGNVGCRSPSLPPCPNG